MQKNRTTHSTTAKLAVAGLLTAAAVAGSLLSVPVAGSKCAPVQHMVNVFAAVILGPWWGVGIAFCASFLRNLMGIGSLLAFPGSMVGALCCGIVYHFTKRLDVTCIAEALGTGVLGGLAAYPVAVLLMGTPAASVAFYAYVIPFLISTAGGTILAAVIVLSLKKTKTLDRITNMLNGRN